VVSQGTQGFCESSRLKVYLLLLRLRGLHLLLLYSLFETEVLMSKKLDLPFGFIHFLPVYPDTLVLNVLYLDLMINFDSLILHAQTLDGPPQLFLLLLIIINKVLESVQQHSESILHLVISVHQCLGFTLMHLGFSAHAI
jgi:hypothetical protein